MKDSSTSIPVIYYHSVADHDKPHPWAFLSVSPRVFKLQMALLRALGYTTCNWQEFYDHIQGLKPLPRKTVFIHFDDGFLDNWTVVYPIMKRHNFKFSILLTAEFVEKSEAIRGFVTHTNSTNEEGWWGYLSEGEIRKMSTTGLVDFQCHGFTHTWLESSKKIIGFYGPETFYPHLNWNLHPELKPEWLRRFSEMTVPDGYPIFEHKKSLELQTAFIPNEDFIQECIEHAEEGCAKLADIYEKYKRQNMLGVFESTEQSKKRMHRELTQTRKYLAELTGTEPRFLVFPGGGNSGDVEELCRDQGYKMISKGNTPNAFNSKNYRVTRYAGFHDFKLPLLNEVLNILLLYTQLGRGRGCWWARVIFWMKTRTNENSI